MSPPFRSSGVRPMGIPVSASQREAQGLTSRVTKVRLSDVNTNAAGCPMGSLEWLPRERPSQSLMLRSALAETVIWPSGETESPQMPSVWPRPRSC